MRVVPGSIQRKRRRENGKDDASMMYSETTRIVPNVVLPFSSRAPRRRG